MPTPDRQTLTKQLAETYTGGYYDDPWAVVEEYQGFLDYAAQHPNAGSQKIATALELPRGRIREWQDGSKPDHVRTVEVADQRGWLDLDWDSETAQAINCLVAWIFAGGSINQQAYVPYFAVEDRTVDCAKRLLAIATDEQPRVNEREGGRATELKPRSGQTAFGRYLSVLGAPVGLKNAERDDLTLPSYLDDAPDCIRADFARIYVWNRGSEIDGDDGYPVQVTLNRSREYQDELLALFESLIMSAVAGERHTYRFTEFAADVLYRPPDICEPG